jgi:ribosome-binding factor A
MPTRRQERVSEMMREELSLLIGAELTDPRLADAMVSVTDVKVSQDLRNARVYVEHVLPPARSSEVLEALRHAETYLRHALVENLDLRFVPMLSFHIDSSYERGRRIDALLDTLAGETGGAAPGPMASPAVSPLVSPIVSPMVKDEG